MALHQNRGETMEIKVRPSVRIDAAKIERERFMKLLEQVIPDVIELAKNGYPVTAEQLLWRVIKGEQE